MKTVRAWWKCAGSRMWSRYSSKLVSPLTRTHRERLFYEFALLHHNNILELAYRNDLSGDICTSRVSGAVGIPPTSQPASARRFHRTKPLAQEARGRRISCVNLVGHVIYSATGARTNTSLLALGKPMTREFLQCYPSVLNPVEFIRS
jgi:hypothetical protein